MSFTLRENIEKILRHNYPHYSESQLRDKLYPFLHEGIGKHKRIEFETEALKAGYRPDLLGYKFVACLDYVDLPLETLDDTYEDVRDDVFALVDRVDANPRLVTRYFWKKGNTDLRPLRSEIEENKNEVHRTYYPSGFRQ